MKKLLKLVLVAFLALGLVACSNGETDTEEKECTIKVTIVTDTGGVDDKSFNQSSWEGAKKYAAEVGEDHCVNYIQSNAEADYVPNLNAAAEDGADLVFAVGFMLADAVAEVAPNFPETKFTIIDGVVEADNVKSGLFAAADGSFSAGVAAALKAKELGATKVGFIGGQSGPVIGEFQAGYEQGVWAVDPTMEVMIDYSESFADEAISQTLAQKQFNNGVAVIFACAGNSGNGAIKEAKERENAWIIGVDRDQFEDGKKEDGSTVILTSMLKKVDQCVYETSKALYEGNFESGIHTYTMSEGGVGAELTEGRNLSAEMIKTISEFETQIKDGSLTVSKEAVIAKGGCQAK